MLADYELNMPIFGHATNRVEWAYVALEHSLEETHRACRRLGVLDIIQTRLFGWVEDEIPPLPDKPGIGNILFVARKRFPDVKLLIVDGVAGMVKGGNINDFGAVRELICSLKVDCQKKDLTIVGIGLDAKGNNPNAFVPYRQRPSGSGAWGQYSSTVFVMEREFPNKIRDPHRKLLVEPRNAAGRDYKFVLDSDGRLQDAAAQEADFFLDLELNACPPGKIVLTRDMVGWGENRGYARATVKRWMTKCLQENRLVYIDKGKYKVSEARHPLEPEP